MQHIPAASAAGLLWRSESCKTLQVSAATQCADKPQAQSRQACCSPSCLSAAATAAAAEQSLCQQQFQSCQADWKSGCTGTCRGPCVLPQEAKEAGTPSMFWSQQLLPPALAGHSCPAQQQAAYKPVTSKLRSAAQAQAAYSWQVGSERL